MRKQRLLYRFTCRTRVKSVFLLKKEKTPQKKRPLTSTAWCAARPRLGFPQISSHRHENPRTDRSHQNNPRNHPFKTDRRRNDSAHRRRRRRCQIGERVVHASLDPLSLFINMPGEKRHVRGKCHGRQRAVQKLYSIELQGRPYEQVKDRYDRSPQ